MHTPCILITANCICAVCLVIAENYMHALFGSSWKIICAHYVWVMPKNHISAPCFVITENYMRTLCLVIAENYMRALFDYR